MITRMLPGLNDKTSLRETYRLLRRSGIGGCLVALACGIGRWFAPDSPELALCMVLAVGWVMTMLGGSILADVRGAVLTTRDSGRPAPGPVMVVIVGLGLVGILLLFLGISLEVSIVIDVISGSSAGDIH